MAYKHIGKNFTPPDLVSKVTGSARFAEDFRADGMAFVKILASPMPHAKIKSVDVSKAEKMPNLDAVPSKAAPVMNRNIPVMQILITGNL